MIRELAIVVTCLVELLTGPLRCHHDLASVECFLGILIAVEVRSVISVLQSFSN